MSNIKILLPSGTSIDVNFITFSDGSETCTIMAKSIFSSEPRIQVSIEDATRDLVRICLVKDALERMYTSTPGSHKLHLTLSYMPQARADRQFTQGQPHALKVFANIINAQNFASVWVEDAHSDVTEALVDRIALCTQPLILQQNKWAVERYMKNFTLCAPDLGAAKKMFDVAKRYAELGGSAEYIQAIKIRDVATGDIVKCDIVGDVVAKRVLIVDDIADGGASFKFLALKLKERGVEEVGLLVTHGIFPNGLNALQGSVDYIFIHNIVGTYITPTMVDNFNSHNYALKSR